MKMRKKGISVVVGTIGLLLLVGVANATVVSPYSGSYAWYSDKGNNLENWLVQDFDLSGLASATFKFQTWYDIETDWDYCFVVISGGLQGSITTNSDPNGQNTYSDGITGNSNGWSEAVFDLTLYVGSQVRLGFLYETDPLIIGTGWLVDDISIDEIGFFDDVESGPGSWEKFPNSSYQVGTSNWYISDGVAPVPEPATMLLFGTGLVGLAGSRFRKKKK